MNCIYFKEQRMIRTIVVQIILLYTELIVVFKYPELLNLEAEEK